MPHLRKVSRGHQSNIKDLWGATYAARSMEETLSFACYTPIVLTRNGRCKVEEKTRNKALVLRLFFHFKYI